MDFDLPEDLQEVKKKAREFALRELTPEVARKYDRDEKFPEELRRKAFASGLIDYSNPWSVLVLQEEFCRVDAGTGICAVSGFFGLETIMLFGNDEQKAKYMPNVINGQTMMGLAVTEPVAGSDVAGIKTTATKSGDYYTLNGAKMFITNGQLADFLMMLARTEPQGPKRHHGLSLFVVETATEGITRNKLTEKLGVRATNTAEIVLNDVKVPAKNLIGEEGKGFYYVMTFFDISRIYTAIQAVGIAQGALDRVLEFMARQGNEALKEQTLTTVGEMAMRIEAARLLTYNAASRLFKFNPDPKLTSMAKAFGSETAVYVTEKALELTGLQGLSGDLERFFRDAKIMDIWEGTSEVEKLTIARTIMREMKKAAEAKVGGKA
ncbi:MAG TPA: acyl-CoA dehydrogenase family protein [Nitrososphaerales archaeon]|nr:acyl-CoA dehydrogenase family protein [Nitrososphaerales archaeon]